MFYKLLKSDITGRILLYNEIYLVIKYYIILLNNTIVKKEKNTKIWPL